MTEEHEELRSFAAHSLNSIDSSYPLVSGRKSRCNLKTIIFGFLISFTIVISVIALIKSGGRNKPVVSEKDLQRLLTLLSNETVDGLRDDLIKTLDQKIDAKFYKAHTDFNNALAAINETIREDIIGNITNLHQKQVTIGTAVDEIHKIVLSTNFVPRTCDEFGLTKGSGYYTIDPLKQKVGHTKFHVKCDFDNDESLTIVEHDKPKKIKIEPCDSTNCFSVQVTYNATMENIKRLLKVASHCYQDIYFSCFSSEFTTGASWTDAQGNHQNYFSSPNANECECHSNKSCFSPNYKKRVTCNCDYGTSKELRDKITIKSKRLLPLTSFHYSHMRPRPHHHASVKLGPLVCKGLRKPRPSSMRTCDDHRANGDPSGYYWIELKKRLTFAFCNTSIENGTNDLTNNLISRINNPTNDSCHDMTYHLLNDESRHYLNSTNGHDCDGTGEMEPGGSHKEWRGQNWYRVVGPAGTRIYDRADDPQNFDKMKCNSQNFGWIATPHPTVKGSTIDGRACISQPVMSYFGVSDFSCLASRDIKIKNCGEYFLYYLRPLNGENYCWTRYCTI